MDDLSADRLAVTLLGQTVGGWLLHSEINHGKSAVVFKGERSGTVAAVKVFSPDIIARFGADSQAKRIERERALRGHGHPNLIETLDGGECPSTHFFFTVMPLVPYPTLSSLITTLPRSRISPILSQVASAAKYLEDRGYTHRDIKPDNIVVTTDFEKAILLDLGVLRPNVDSDITDTTAAKEFIATVRYSSPEYLVREEGNDEQKALRALTFYQLGGVLHDMIMRAPLFHDRSQPWPRLIRAVLQEVPQTAATDVPGHLLHLCRNCLLKNPSLRLQSVSWDSFLQPAPTTSSLEDLISRVQARASADRVQDLTAPSGVFRDSVASIRSWIRSVCIDSGAFPPLTVVSYPPDDDDVTTVVRLHMAPAASFGLRAHLHIALSIHLEATSPTVVSIDFTACVTNSRQAPPPSPSPSPAFRGVLDQDAVTARLTPLLFGALDQAQTLPDAPESARWLNVTAPEGADSG